MRKSVCTAALFLASATVSSLADDSDKQAKTPLDITLDAANLTVSGLAEDSDKQAKADREKAEKEAKEASEKAEKKAKEASEKAEKKAKEARKKEEKKAEEPWGIAFGAALLSDYNFRGISASDHRPAVSAYFESHYDFSRSLQAYLQVETNSITFASFEAPAVYSTTCCSHTRDGNS